MCELSKDDMRRAVLGSILAHEPNIANNNNNNNNNNKYQSVSENAVWEQAYYCFVRAQMAELSSEGNNT